MAGVGGSLCNGFPYFRKLPEFIFAVLTLKRYWTIELRYIELISIIITFRENDSVNFSGELLCVGGMCVGGSHVFQFFTVFMDFECFSVIANITSGLNS